MSERIIRIKNCVFCPYMQRDRILGTPRCSKTVFQDDDIAREIYFSETRPIPDWCPLEEVKE